MTFADFVVNLTIICVICLAVTVVYFVYWYKKDYLMAEVKDVAHHAYLKEGIPHHRHKLTDQWAWPFWRFTIFLFIIHGVLHMEPSIAAMIGAMICW